MEERCFTIKLKNKQGLYTNYFYGDDRSLFYIINEETVTMLIACNTLKNVYRELRGQIFDGVLEPLGVCKIELNGEDITRIVLDDDFEEMMI